MRKKIKQASIGWLDYLRQAIAQKVKESKREEAAESMDKIRNKTKKVRFDSIRSVREDRNA